MIIIPMAGLSSRFAKAGYDKPKYMLPLGGRSVFAHSVSSFKNDFRRTPFVIIYRPIQDTRAFLEAEIAKLGIGSVQFVELTEETRGQAETVALGVRQAQVAKAVPLTIFNIDTFRPGFTFPDIQADGWLDVFEGSGDNWSFARVEAGTDRVVEVAEKKPISNLCCTGLYHFARTGDFMRAFEAEAREVSAELYVAPLYNRLIAKGADIRVHVITRDEVIFCGVPAEYESLCVTSP